MFQVRKVRAKHDVKVWWHVVWGGNKNRTRCRLFGQRMVEWHEGRTDRERQGRVREGVWLGTHNELNERGRPSRVAQTCNEIQIHTGLL